jgi:hypothetical protein
MTLEKIKSDLIKKHPSLKSGSEETGYVEITGAEYDAIIDDWANAAHAKELQELAQKQKAATKQALLDRLGISADEAASLLS